MAARSELSGLPVHAKIYVQDLIKLEFDVQNVIQEIRECKGSNAVLNDLNLHVKRRLTKLRQKIQDLEQIAEEQDRETDRLLILKSVSQHQNQITCLQASLRKANLTTKMAIDKSERDSLFSGSGTRNRSYNKEQLVKTSSNITENLMSIARLMNTQVKAGEEDMKLLAESSKTVADTHEEYKGLSSVINTSKKLLNKYNRRELTDKLLIFFGLVLFFSTVLYIIKKRILP